MLGNKILDHFEHPRNYGEVEEPDGTGCAGKPARGITIEISVKVHKEVIREVKFKTAGCATSIASASMVTELVKGMPVEKALLLSPEDVSQALGGIPQEKMHCSELAVKALLNALTDCCTRTQGRARQKVE